MECAQVTENKDYGPRPKYRYRKQQRLADELSSLSLPDRLSTEVISVGYPLVSLAQSSSCLQQKRCDRRCRARRRTASLPARSGGEEGRVWGLAQAPRICLRLRRAPPRRLARTLSPP